MLFSLGNSQRFRHIIHVGQAATAQRDGPSVINRPGLPHLHQIGETAAKGVVDHRFQRLSLLGTQTFYARGNIVIKG
jgi:hypothetical protein